MRASRQTYNGRRAASRAADAVAKLPSCSVLPVISGTLEVGETLACTSGTWSNTPDAYAYQWNRDSVAIASAITNQYELVAADEGAVITCTVVATNLGVSAVAVSAPTEAIAA